MCYTFAAAMTEKELEQRFQADRDESIKFQHEANYYLSGFTFPSVSIVKMGEEGPILSHCNWGLIPAWVQDEKKADTIRAFTLNAKSESLTEKPSFKHLLTSNRCIVPASGFFEWKHEGKAKNPYYIFRANSGIMAFAGLYESWCNNRTGEIANTCTIITTSANELVAKIHNTKKRMPVILTRGNEELWIDPKYSEQDALQLLLPLETVEMAAHPISSNISKKNGDKNHRGTIAAVSPPPVQGNLFD